jgi:NADH dehydrogenase (ubiquinone) 1 beta subcomplex subunit 11
VTRKLVIRPLPSVFLQSVRSASWPPKESSDPTDVRPRIGKFINKGKTEKAVDKDEINPGDPHDGTGLGDINIGPGLMRRMPPPKTVEDFAKPHPKIWFSYGFDIWNQREDRIEAHWYFFIIVTVVVFGGSVFGYYLPDIRLSSWALREAYMEIERRKALGKPYISRDYVPAELIRLPTDEELGDEEIII